MVFIITFDACFSPEEISIGWTRCQVREYIPSHRHCFKFQKFDHGYKSCHSEESICVNCGLNSHGDGCVSVTKCHNCGEAHPASSRDCFYYKLEQETVTVQTRERISYLEAKKCTTDKVLRPTQSYAYVTTIARTQVSQTAQRHIKDPQGTHQALEQRTDVRNATITARSTPISLTLPLISQVAIPPSKPAITSNPTW